MSYSGNIKFSNHAKTTLSSALSSGSTSVSVTSASLFPTITPPQYYYVTIESATDATTYEVVKVTSVSSNTLTVTRNIASSTGSAQDWSSGAKVELRLPKEAIVDLETQLSAYTDSVAGGLGLVSDTAYGAGWNGVTTIAPSKNAVYDQMVLMAPLASPTFTGTVTADALTTTGTVILGDAVGDTVTVNGTMTVAEESTVSKAVTISSAVPGVTTNKLYNNGGTLYWNGAVLNTGGSSVTGTLGKIAKFTGGTAVGDSIMAESGSTIAVTGAITATEESTFSKGFTVSSYTPGVTTNKLYNVAGTLYFNGSSVGGASWSAAGSNTLTTGYIVQGTNGVAIPYSAGTVTASNTTISMQRTNTTAVITKPMIYVEETSNSDETQSYNANLWGNLYKHGPVVVNVACGSSEAGEVNGIISQVTSNYSRQTSTNTHDAGVYYPLLVGISSFANTTKTNDTGKTQASAWAANLVARQASAGTGTQAVDLVGIEVNIVNENDAIDGTSNYTAYWAQAAGGGHIASAAFKATGATSSDGWIDGININSKVTGYLAKLTSGYAGGKGVFVNIKGTGTPTNDRIYEGYFNSSGVFSVDGNGGVNAGNASSTHNFGGTSFSVAGGTVNFTGTGTMTLSGVISATNAGSHSFAGSIGLTGSAALSTVNGNISISGSGVFSGNGSSLTALNATQLTSGSIPAGRYANNTIPIAALAGYPGTTTGFLRGDGTWTDTLTSGQFVLLGSNAGIELGATGSVNTPFIDFHSSGVNQDYDFRFLASGGTTGVGLGALSTEGLFVIGASNATRSGLRMAAGTAPSSPSDGDIWYDGANLKMRVGGSTKTFTLV